MTTIETALALFRGRDQIEKEIGVDDEKWENEIGPALIFLEKQKLVSGVYSHEVDYPVYADLTSAGVKRRNQLIPVEKPKMLTAQDKDVILRYLVDNFQIGSWAALLVDQPIHGISGDQLDSVLSYFGKLDLIDYEGYTTVDRGHVMLILRVEAHEFIQEGGFFGKYELFQKTVEKLIGEVEKLEHEEQGDNNKFTDYRKKIQEYASVIANVATAIGVAKDILKK